MRKKIAAMALFVGACSVPLSFFAAAIWTARTYSYSEKLGCTGALLLAAFVPVGLVCAFIWDSA